MTNLAQMLKQLRGERSRTQKELSRFDDAIAAIDKLVGNNPGRTGKKNENEAQALRRCAEQDSASTESALS